jgi:hypothetical protein
MDAIKPAPAVPHDAPLPADPILADKDHATCAWNAACLRLEEYLCAHLVEDRAVLLRLTLRILDEARRFHAREPQRSPIAMTMEIAVSLTESWFARLAGGDDAQADLMLVSRGRVAYFATSAYRKWPQAFLDPHPPEELVTTVRNATLEAGPGLEFTRLVRQEVEYGPMEQIARETWEKFSWGHVLRAFAIWVGIFVAAYVSYLQFFQ